MGVIFSLSSGDRRQATEKNDPLSRHVFLLSHTRFVLARGVLGEFLMGVSRPVLQILTLLETKKSHFPHPFSDQTSKIHYYHHYLD